MNTVDKMLEDLKPFLSGKKVLELGCGNGKYTNKIAPFAEIVTAIDVSDERLSLAKENTKDKDNIVFKKMNADNLLFDDKSFDVIIGFDCFHEFDPTIQLDVLKEARRVGKDIIIMDSDEKSVGNELFKVFDPNEDHALRIRNANNKMMDFMKDNNMELVLQASAQDFRYFDSRDHMLNSVLSWWDDIRIPQNDEEKSEMLNEITNILNNENMLERLEYIQLFNYFVFKES